MCSITQKADNPFYEKMHKQTARQTGSDYARATCCEKQCHLAVSQNTSAQLPDDSHSNFCRLPEKHTSSVGQTMNVQTIFSVYQQLLQGSK